MLVECPYEYAEVVDRQRDDVVSGARGEPFGLRNGRGQLVPFVVRHPVEDALPPAVELRVEPDDLGAARVRPGDAQRQLHCLGAG